MSGRLHTWFDLFDWFVMVYFLLLNSSYLLLVAVAAHEMVRSLRRAGIEGYDDIFANPLTPAVSVLVPAHNEEAGIVESVRAMLTLRYPEFEIVVVDDGSTDATFQRLADVFDLVQVDRVDPAVVPVEGRVLSAHAPRGGEPILVIRKQSAGRRSDALNCGLNFARFPLVCMIDADSLLEEDALLRVVKPFVDDPPGWSPAAGWCGRPTGRWSTAAGWSTSGSPAAGWRASRWSSTCARSCSAAPAGRASRVW